MWVSRVTGPSSFARAMAKHHAGCAVPSPDGGDSAAAFEMHQSLGTRNQSISWPTSMAHALAYLRFAGTVTGTVARLATGWAGSPLAGWDSHPQDNKRSFTEASFPPIPIDQPCLVAQVIQAAFQVITPLLARVR
jgi:hypothetical protein